MSKSRLSSEVFYWDAPSRSLHKRDLFPLLIEVEGNKYVAPKWTLKHFKIVNFKGPVPKSKVFTVYPIVRFRNFNVQFETKAVFLHYDGANHELIARFEEIPEEHRELLCYFLEALETGDMVNIDNVLRRVDMPVLPASTKLTPVPEKKSFQFKRVLYSTLYLLLGMWLFYFTGSAIYKKLTQVEIDYAFVSMPLIPIQSPFQGEIEELLISQGNMVTKGQPLLKLDTTSNNEIPSSYKLDAAKQQLVLYEALIKEKMGNAGQNKVIREKKLSAAKAALTAAKANRNLKCNRRFESDIDRRNPQKRRAECDAARVMVSSARSRVSSENTALLAANKLTKYSSVSLQVLRAKLEQTKLKVEELETKPDINLGNELLFSNVDGKVITVIEDQHQYLSKGQTVALIQQSNTEQHIEGFVTQEQAVQLKIGDSAIIDSPLLADKIEAIVEDIEYTENKLVKSNKRIFNWSVPQKNSAKVVLSFKSDHVTNLPFGLPVSVSIKKAGSLAAKLLNKNDDDLFSVASADAREVVTATSYCKNKLRLFPADFAKNRDTDDLNKILGISWKEAVLGKAQKYVKEEPQPLKSLNSAGVTDPNSVKLKQTRTALRDANSTAVLALAFLLSDEQSYLDKAKEYLLAWATTYNPNGHPIDETRLEGFLWAYDLLRCKISWQEQEDINAWLKTIQQKKQQWKFGPSSSKNNFRTHQLKMLLMLDRLLDDNESLENDRETLKEHARNNLLKDGQTIDYKERDALHYHVFDLEPWLEIALLEPAYKEPVNKAYDFLVKQLKEDNINHEFSKSKLAIDVKRAKGGFEYAQKGGTFDVSKVTRSVIVHSSLNKSELEKDESLSYVDKARLKQNIFFVSRHFLLNK